jgi:hypothetical protein
MSGACLLTIPDKRCAPSYTSEVTMRTHMKEYTEPIFTTLDRYRAELTEHPLLRAARAGQIERTILEAFAYYQYADSITWIPMLAQMKSLAIRSRRLQAAIEDNIAHESGIGGTSHTLLAARLMRSLDIRSLTELPTEGLATTASLWLSDAFATMPEPALAGWLLTAETLVPQMFADVAPCFDAIGADTTYFHHHVSVDTDEHSAWMAEAVDDVISIYGPACIPTILEGMDDAWQETCEDPDTLWRLRCASH